MNTTTTGNHAENAASEALQKQGYTILIQNWKTPFAEIDIVAEKNKTLYFVEVKYRRTDYAGDGFDYITTQKLSHMQRAAEAYVREAQWRAGYELMAVSVMGEPDNLTLEFRDLSETL